MGERDEDIYSELVGIWASKSVFLRMHVLNEILNIFRNLKRSVCWEKTSLQLIPRDDILMYESNALNCDLLRADQRWLSIQYT